MDYWSHIKLFNLYVDQDILFIFWAIEQLLSMVS